MAIICAAAMLFTMGCGNKGVSDYTTDDTVSNALSGENTVAVETTPTEIPEVVPEAQTIDSLNNGIIIDEVSGTVYKTEQNGNPISTNIFCADPTAVEYEGRLYVYGTNDTEQAEKDAFRYPVLLYYKIKLHTLPITKIIILDALPIV